MNENYTPKFLHHLIKILNPRLDVQVPICSFSYLYGKFDEGQFYDSPIMCILDIILRDVDFTELSLL